MYDNVVQICKISYPLDDESHTQVSWNACVFGLLAQHVVLESKIHMIV